jgi:cell division protein ZapE
LDPGQAAAALKLDALAAALDAPPASWMRRLIGRIGPAPTAPVRGLYLYGGVGRGKTLLMDYFYESLLHAPRERTHFYRFMRDMHARLRAVKEREDPLELVAAGIAERTRLLCLDEFFVSDIADAMLLAGLLQGLFQRGVTLVTTSNVAPRDLYRDGLQRARFLPAIELIETHLSVLQLDGGIDYRLRQLEQAPTYLDSTDPATPLAFKQRFAGMAGAQTLGPTNLLIEERPIRATATGPGLVWFEFDAICEGPRSQNDYIEIARLFHTVFVSNVPVFTQLNEDAARRFIMLIDELYDRGVNIVVSAAAAPTDLYQGEKLRFEFERAASRLIEMQTEAYLSGEHRP